MVTVLGISDTIQANVRSEEAYLAEVLTLAGCDLASDNSILLSKDIICELTLHLTKSSFKTCMFQLE